VKRREVITFLGSAAAWPLAARAQQPPTPLVGFLDSVSVEPRRDALVAFRQGLGETGHTSRLSTAGHRVDSTDCRIRQPILFADRPR
jgi:putative ABC transport system substrate-binding protein